MTRRQASSAPGTIVLPADPDDTAELDTRLRPLGWCVEPDPAQARPGHLRLRPLVRDDPEGHDGGRTFKPGATISWTDSDLVLATPNVPGPLRPFLALLLEGWNIPEPLHPQASAGQTRPDAFASARTRLHTRIAAGGADRRG